MRQTLGGSIVGWSSIIRQIPQKTWVIHSQTLSNFVVSIVGNANGIELWVRSIIPSNLETFARSTSDYDLNIQSLPLNQFVSDKGVRLIGNDQLAITYGNGATLDIYRSSSLGTENLVHSYSIEHVYFGYDMFITRNVSQNTLTVRSYETITDESPIILYPKRCGLDDLVIAMADQANRVAIVYPLGFAENHGAKGVIEIIDISKQQCNERILRTVVCEFALSQQGNHISHDGTTLVVCDETLSRVRVQRLDMNSDDNQSDTVIRTLPQGQRLSL